MNNEMPDRWYSTKEICAYLGISRDTMLVWIATKNMPAHIGMIPDDEIDALADVILPGVIKFFSSDEWRVEFDEWKKEQELLARKKEGQNGVA